MREWRKNNKEHLAARSRERRKDLIEKLKNNLRVRLNQAIKRNYKNGSAVRDLGCTIEEFKLYLEIRFKPGMSWSNHGDWHIDHIIPLASFDLTDPSQLKKALHFTNMQPLWKKENISKGSKTI